MASAGSPSRDLNSCGETSQESLRLRGILCHTICKGPGMEAQGHDSTCPPGFALLLWGLSLHPTLLASTFLVSLSSAQTIVPPWGPLLPESAVSVHGPGAALTGGLAGPETIRDRGKPRHYFKAVNLLPILCLHQSCEIDITMFLSKVGKTENK